MKNTLYLLIVISCLLASCKKDSTTTTTSTVPDGSVIIINEGGFHAGNASVTLFDPATKKTTADLFNHVNGRPLGDIGQSMIIHNGKGYIVVNNSAKIEVVDINTFASVGTINITGSSPRYILPISGSKAYVSDLFSGKINIIDLDAYTVTGSINVPGETEQMILVNNNAYVLNIVNGDSTLVQVINPTNDTKTGTIAMSLHGGLSMVIDNSNKLWVLCSPYDTTHTKASGLVRINPATATVEQTLAYPTSQSGYSALTVSPNGSTLCYLDFTGMYKMNVTDNALPSSTFIAAGTRSFYGIGIDNASQKVYLGDAGNFTSNGKVYSYKLADGTAADTIDAGVSPAHFMFK